MNFLMKKLNMGHEKFLNIFFEFLILFTQNNFVGAPRNPIKRLGKLMIF